MNPGNCPYCQAKLRNVRVEPIEIKEEGAIYNGVSYVCPLCHAVLTVAMDPLSLNADLVRRLLKALGKGS